MLTGRCVLPNLVRGIRIGSHEGGSNTKANPSSPQCTSNASLVNTQPVHTVWGSLGQRATGKGGGCGQAAQPDVLHVDVVAVPAVRSRG